MADNLIPALTLGAHMSSMTRDLAADSVFHVPGLFRFMQLRNELANGDGNMQIPYSQVPENQRVDRRQTLDYNLHSGGSGVIEQLRKRFQGTQGHCRK